jgi:hypothetical protein
LLFFRQQLLFCWNVFPRNKVTSSFIYLYLLDCYLFESTRETSDKETLIKAHVISWEQYLNQNFIDEALMGGINTSYFT